MAVTFESFTGPVNRSGGTTLAFTYPSSIAAGNLLLFVLQGVSNTWDPNTYGFTLLDSVSQNQGGTTREVEVWYKVATGSESGSFTITATGGNAWSGVVFRYSNSTGNWDLAASKNSATTATSHAIAGDVNPGIAAGDHIVAAATCGTSSGSANAGGASSETVTATGCTFTNETEVADGLNTSGSDHYYIVSRHECSAGPASSVPTYNFTIVNTQAATCLMTRIREASGGGGGKPWYYQLQQRLVA